jgi:membrane-associated phospholipid phosphatase
MQWRLEPRCRANRIPASRLLEKPMNQVYAPPRTPATGPGPAPPTSKRAARRLVRAAWLLGILVVLGGFCGGDRVFYEHVSRRLNPQDDPLARSFYNVTRPFWLACRYSFAHVLGLSIIYFAVLALHRNGWRAANAALAGVVAAAIVANVAQGAIGRLRPNQATSQRAFTQPTLNPLRKDSVGFPSGEAAMAFALACVLTRLAPRWRAAFYAAGTLAAVARLMNGAHYPSDVAAGALLGVLLARPVFSLVDRHHDRLFARRPADPHR